ncbi:MAG: lysophospholipase [Bacteroidales bacterium]|nr:lysophospholipase [Bacteroidales bacterium]
MTEFKLKSADGAVSLSVAVFMPESSPKGIVQIVHGMCEHKERYYPFMDFLRENGYASIIHDQRGHGATVSSPEDLGYMGKDGWLALLDDVKTVNGYIREACPGLPLTLFGHSMGSLVVRCYTKRYDSTINRLFVCGSPSDNPAKGAGAVLATLFGVLRGWHYRPKLLNTISFAGYNKGFEGDGFSRAWVCSDTEVLEKYHNDPLCRFRFTSDGFLNLMKLVQDCYSQKGWKVENPELPVHFISGALDPCRISDKALGEAVDLMKKVGYGNVSLKIYPGMRHELLNEKDHLSVWNDVLSNITPQK